MEKSVFIFVLGLAAHIRSAYTSSETVWLKDVTRRFQTDKRTLNDLDFPNELTFHLKRGSDALTLNLRRNHAINPNADVYFVQKLKDGEHQLLKSENVESADLAYYQDIENGAYMTVRCAKRSGEECDRVINGNIRIGNNNYDLQPAVADAGTRNLFEDLGVTGKRYVIKDQTYFGKTNSVENKDVANVQEVSEEQKHQAFLRESNGKRKQNPFNRADDSLLSQNVADLHNSWEAEKSHRSKDEYYVDVMVIIDPGVWDLFYSLVQTTNAAEKTNLVTAKIKEYYSHLINGVDLIYREIQDPSISIEVTLSGFLFFQLEGSFPHLTSNITIINGVKYIEQSQYIHDLYYWDMNSTNNVMVFDQGLLFTRYNLYNGSPSNNKGNGISNLGGVCDLGRRFSIIEASDYSLTVRTAAHELGHGLGAVHDGVGEASACKPSDLFLMAPEMYVPTRRSRYTRNPWLFSHCSVGSFKKKLIAKDCVKVKGKVYNEQEWMNYTMNQPGEVYSLNEQCSIFTGPKSRFWGSSIRSVCEFMECMDPRTKMCMRKYFGAARGTKCGDNMWCIEGKCVSKV